MVDGGSRIEDGAAASVVGVLDLLDGSVVRAVGGRRERYRPWRSPLTDSSDPIEIAGAFREYYGLAHLYIADLNALRGEAISHTVVEQLVSAGFHVTLDAGPRTEADITTALAMGANIVVLPLETLPHRSTLADWCRQFDRGRLAFGLDLKQGVPLANHHVWDIPESDWDHRAAERIAQEVIALGISRLIILDLHSVGQKGGPATAELCTSIRRSAPAATIWTGGGIRDSRDIATLRAAGADRVLIATALHERTLDLPQM